MRRRFWLPCFPGLYIFAAWLMNDQVLKWALGPHLHVHDLVSAVLLIMCIFMMAPLSHDETYSLPPYLAIWRIAR